MRRSRLASCLLAVTFLCGPGLVLAQACFNESFDTVTAPALPSGWSSVLLSGPAQTVPWRTRAVGYTASGSNAAWIDDSTARTDLALLSPVYPRPSGSISTLLFRHSYFLWQPDPGPLANGVYNGGILEMSIDGGAFAEVSAAGGTISTGPYTSSLDPAWDSPLAPAMPFNRQLWGGSTNGFVNVGVTLPSVGTTGTVQFRWRMGTEGGGRGFDTYSGWWVDSVSFRAFEDALFSSGFEDQPGCGP